MNSKSKVMETYILTNVYIKNLHNNCMFPKKELFFIKLHNGDLRIIDFIGGKDIGDASYYEIVRTNKTKEIRDNPKRHCMKMEKFLELAMPIPGNN